MEQNAAFKPAGPVTLIAATPSGGTATQPQGPLIGGELNYLVVNPSGAPDVFLGYGPTSGAATGNGVVPLLGGSRPLGNQAGTLHVPGGSIHTFTLAPGTFFSPITQLGSCSMSITAGFGL